MNRRRWIHLAALALVVIGMAATVAIAQRGRGYRREFRPGEPLARGGVPEWKNDEQFKDDVFIFTRVRYKSYDSGYGWGRRGGRWATDYPDADLNLSFRLQQLTTIETDPNGRVVELTDDALFDCPLIYLIEPGGMYLDDDEVKALRKYCLNGGFLWVDDFWGAVEWENFEENIKRVFPDRQPKELALDHPIFHCVYDLKKKPQVPSIHSDWETYTTDRPWDPSAVEVHYYGVYDDKGRMMAFIGHNTDIGDGWEREGVSLEYFKLYSEKWSYPMGINIVTYAMTH